MATFTLNKSERLKSYIRIRELFAKGRKLRQFPLLVFYRIEKRKPEDVGNPLQMGVSVSTRSFKKAVDRNLMKRRIREAYRLQNTSLKSHVNDSEYSLDLFFVFSDNKLTAYADLAATTEKLLLKLDQYFIEYINAQNHVDG